MIMKTAVKTKTHVRKIQIKNAALELIRKNGPNALTMSLIAKKVGVANSNLYRHFGGKEEIYAAIIYEISDSLQQIVNNAKKIDSPVESLRSVYFGHLSYFEDNKNYPRIIFSELLYSANKELLANFKNYITNYLNSVENILKLCQEKNLLIKNTNIETAALTFLGQIQSLTLQWMLSGCDFSLKERAKRFWIFYLRSVVSKPIKELA